MRHVILAALLSAAHSSPASASPNLLANGDFKNTNQIASWTLYLDFNAGTLAWNSDDADASASSGSIELDTDSIGEPTHATSGCFAVPAGGAFSIGGQSKVVVVNGIGTTGFVFDFSCSIYSAPNCSTGGITTIDAAMSYSLTWSQSVSVGGILPNSSKSADCDIHQYNVYNAASASIRFDNLFFTADYIFRGGFE